jgi:hypothetical protein
MNGCFAGKSFRRIQLQATVQVQDGIKEKGREGKRWQTEIFDSKGREKSKWKGGLMK